MSKIGSMLRAVGLIDDAQLQRALEEQKRTHETIGTILVKLGFISETDLTNTLGKQLGVASVDLSHFEIDANVLKIIPEDIARKYKVIPLHRMGYTITLAMANPTNVMAIDDIKFRTGYNIEPVVAAETSIMKAIDAYYGTDAVNMSSISDALDEDMDLTEFEVIEEEEDVSEQELLSQVEDEPVVKLVQQVIAKAVLERASDIHIEPYEKSVRVRFRIDGTLQTVLEPPKNFRMPLFPVSRSCPSWISPSGGFPRTAVPSSKSRKIKSLTFVSLPFQLYSARRWSCVSLTRRTCVLT